MLFINSDPELRAYLPGAQSTAEGEPTMFDRLHPYLVQAEGYVVRRFLGSRAARIVADTPGLHMAAAAAGRMTAARAMMTGIPALDLVMTPHGFGIVSTESIAPASAERVARLTDSMRRMLDEGADDLLAETGSDPGLHEAWRESEAAAYWTRTLFQTPGDMRDIPARPGDPAGAIERHALLLPEIEAAEKLIATRWLSPALMDVLRGLRRPAADVDPRTLGRIRSAVRAAVAIRLAGEGRKAAALLDDTVDEIRRQPGLWPEWAGSETAQLFDQTADMRFRNRKDSSGFWF